MKPKFLFYPLFFALCEIEPLFSQSSNFITFSVEEGLIQSHVQTLQQDDDGNLWIGTIGGLTRYNGTKFINYTQENGLSEDWISVSLKDSKGNLWFGHWGGGLTVYNYKTKKFIDLKSEVFTNYKKIICLAEDRDGLVYAGTEGAGIAVYRPFLQTENDPSADSAALPKPEMMEGLSNNGRYPAINALFTDNENRLWIGSGAGIFIYDISGKKISGSLNTSGGFPDNSIQCIVEPYENELWIGTENAGIVRLKKDKISSGEITLSDSALVRKMNTSDKLTSDNIKTLFADKSHILWIGTKNGGINQFIPSGNLEKRDGFVHGEISAFSNKFEMKYYNANVFCQDREDNIWVGTEIGLHRYTGELFRVYNYNDGLLSNLVWAILHDRKGDLWFSTSDGVSRFTFPERNGQKQYSNPSVKNYTVADGLPDNLIISLFEDSKGNTWFGTQDKGVSVLTKEIKKGRKEETEVEVFKNYSAREGLADNNIFSICEDGEGNIWLGTRNGASQLNPETKEIKNFTSGEGLGGNKVFKIFRDSKNNLWFGILGGYLTRYDGKEFKTFNLNQKFILSMDEDKDGNIWFGAYGGGIIKYDPGEKEAGKQFMNFTAENGLSSNSPLFIICDEVKNVWIGQSRGIEKFDAQTQRFSLYARQQGFPGVETNENAVAKDNEGNIWFGAIKGVIRFSPAKEKQSQTEPLTSITSLRLFLKEIPFSNSFSYNENYLSFSSLAVCLTNPKDVLYQYKLEGFDADWIAPAPSNTITYSNLPPGNYTFMVKASNGENIWNSEPATYSFTISPPFWETLWFRISSGVFILAVIISVIALREQSLKKEKKILEEKVAERTRELREEKEVVETQNREIQKKNLNITESIGYAKRIQQAILPSIEVVNNLLPDSFIFYKPKDIVSGDFYWIHNSGNNVLFAAVDCTGHGVPGAFMSIISHNILEQITRQKLHEPAMLLDTLSREVSNSLRKSSSATLKDGMDIALCSFDKSTNILQFAAAGNSLYIVNPKRASWPKESARFHDNLPGTEIKADRQSIGAQTTNKPFTNHRVELQKGDMLYIFSDGYADQKGGTDKKKFYYAPFRKLLSDIYDLPLTEQRKHLKETIINWMGDTEQYDDMLIFGVKI